MSTTGTDWTAKKLRKKNGYVRHIHVNFAIVRKKKLKRFALYKQKKITYFLSSHPM